MTVTIPEWTLGDRMRKALAHADISATEMAEYLECSPASMSAWTTGRTMPRKATLLAWALRTGVPYEWLVSGTLSGAPGARSSTDRASDYGSVVLHSRRFQAVQTSSTLVKAA